MRDDFYSAVTAYMAEIATFSCKTCHAHMTVGWPIVSVQKSNTVSIWLTSPVIYQYMWSRLTQWFSADGLNFKRQLATTIVLPSYSSANKKVLVLSYWDQCYHFRASSAALDRIGQLGVSSTWLFSFPSIICFISRKPHEQTLHSSHLKPPDQPFGEKPAHQYG